MAFLTSSMVLGLRGFSCRSAAYLLTVVSNRIARAFNRSGTVSLDISKTFDKVWHPGLLPKLKSYGILGQIFGLISSFLSNRRPRVVLGSLHKNIQLMMGFLKAPFLVQHFSYYTLMTFLMLISVLLLCMPMTLLSILSVIRHLICGNN